MGGKVGLGLLLGLSLLVIAEGLSWVTASWPSPCLVQIENQDEAAYNDNQKSCPTFHVGSEIILARLDSFIGSHDKSIVAAFTVVLAISTIGLWLATVRLWEAGERQIKVMAAGSRRQYEAMMDTVSATRESTHVASRSAEAAEKAADAADKSAKSLQALERGNITVAFGKFREPEANAFGIEIGLKNNGRTRVVVNDVVVKFEYGNLPERPDYRNALPNNIRSLVTEFSPEQPLFVFDKPFLFDRQREPICYGYVRYADVFERMWTYRFAVKIHPTKSGIERCPSVGPGPYHEVTEGWNV